MNDYEYAYTVCGKDIGKPCFLTDVSCVILHESQLDELSLLKFEKVVPVNLVVDNVPQISVHEVNTESVAIQSRGQTHSEGGWPKEVDFKEPQDTTKWRKRLDKDPQFIGIVASLCRDMKYVLDQNNSIDMYEEYYSGESVDVCMQSYDCETVGLFRDPFGGHIVANRQTTFRGNRPISRLCWHPDGGGSRFLSCYSLTKYQRMDMHSPSGFPSSCFVWETENSLFPLYELFPTSPLVVAQFYPRNGELIAGGGYNGMVDYFDMRVGYDPVSVSEFEFSHSEPIFDLSWIQSKTNSELVTVSPDGKVLWWDTRNLKRPIETVTLAANSAEIVGGKSLGATCVEWQQEAGPGKYLIGTEQGVCVSLNKKPKKEVEVSYPWYGSGNGGGVLSPICAVKRNPFHPKYFMTVGSIDACMKLWVEEIRSSCITQTVGRSTVALTCGSWSPSRPGVFATGKFNGCVDFFDYANDMNQVCYTHRVTSDESVPVTALSIEPSKGALMAVGDGIGNVTLIKQSPELCVPINNEKGLVGSIFEKEQQREKNLDSIRKHAKNGFAVFSENAATQNISPNVQLMQERETNWLKLISGS